MSDFCIPANPDISGIGVRTAIYVQNLLSFGPAIYTLLDKKVSQTELASLEVQSTTILFTAFAILLSTIVQVLTLGLSNFHATIILDLSWMNNTNTFIYFLLYAHSKEFFHNEMTTDVEATTSIRRRLPWTNQGKIILTNLKGTFVLLLGSLHLSLMAAVGIWLWSRPSAFGTEPECAVSLASISILGQSVHLASNGLRIWSILIYALLLVPGLNLVIPIIGLIAPSLAYSRVCPKSTRHQVSIIPVGIGLCLLVIINFIFLLDIELAIHRNLPLQEQGESDWTFGQTLALLLLLVPLRDLVETFLARKRKALEKDLTKATRQLGSSLNNLDHKKHEHNSSQFKDISKLIFRWNTAKDRFLEDGPNGYSQNVSISLTNSKYGSVLGATLNAKEWGIAEFLIEHDPKGGTLILPPDQCGMALQDATNAGKLKIIQYLIQNGAPVNYQGGEHGSALQAASYNNHLDIVKYLLNHGAEVNIKDNVSDNGTPLQAASHKGHLEIVKYLTENHANVNLPGGKRCQIPLTSASHQGHLKIVRYLLEHGAHIDYDDGDNQPYTALHTASFHGHLDIVKLLIDNNSDVNYLGRRGTPLLKAASKKHLNVVKYLIEHGAYINTSSETHGAALHAASHAQSLEIVKYLVEHDADVNIKGGEHGSALQAASLKGNLKIVTFLVEKGADVNIQGGNCGSALQAASFKGHLDIVKYLVQQKADVNIKGGQHGTAFQAAESQKHSEIVKFLLDCGAKPDSQL